MFVKVSIIHTSMSLVNTVTRNSQLSKYLPLNILLGDERYGRTALLFFFLFKFLYCLSVEALCMSASVNITLALEAYMNTFLLRVWMNLQNPC